MVLLILISLIYINGYRQHQAEGKGEALGLMIELLLQQKLAYNQGQLMFCYKGKTVTVWKTALAPGPA